MIRSLENVVSADISRMSFFCNDLIAVNDFGPFVHYLVFNMSILANNSMR